MTDRLDYLCRRPWRQIDLPTDALSVPTMLTEDERKLLYGLARDYAADDAAIVDAGCFLGGSTAALLAGLRDRPEPWRGPALESYDRFRVEAYTIPLFFAGKTDVREGDSFRASFDAHVRDFGVPHVVHEGDVTNIGWSGGPIDVLFLDLVKSWKINDAVLRDFFPFLVPGRSVIVHQDYGWGAMPWLPITVELMRDSLRLIDRMEAGTHAFFVERPFPAGLLERGLRGLDHERQLELVERAVDHSDSWTRGMIEITRAAMLGEREGRDGALNELTRVANRYRDYPFVLSCLGYVRDGLETGWHDAGARHFERLAGSRANP